MKTLDDFFNDSTNRAVISILITAHWKEFDELKADYLKMLDGVLMKQIKENNDKPISNIL